MDLKIDKDMLLKYKLMYLKRRLKPAPLMKKYYLYHAACVIKNITHKCLSMKLLEMQ